MAKMKVTVLTGPQGSGKSTVMREEVIAQHAPTLPAPLAA